MDPITLDPHPAGGHSPDRTRAVAGVIGDAVRSAQTALSPIAVVHRDAGVADDGDA